VYVDGEPQLGGEAACVADDPPTITCTERDGKQIVFGWHGTDDALRFEVISGGEKGDADVMEPAPWVRVP
jgi:hypothetical protein